ncbi:hypothetical protein L4D13_18435 [Photobacterium profundum]|uniref:MAE_28990/MAE_18760 family HEPN-like nuclease n=1 Tax=Photobacterium profundum TaxID=74109 RepID=UPI003D0CD2D2
MELVQSTFQDRLNDIESYFDLVSNIEMAAGSGGAIFKVQNSSYLIRPEQQKIMYSGIYLHLYNLVESTISMLINAVERHAMNDIDGQLDLLTENMRNLYIKSITAPQESLTYEKKLEKAILLFEQARNLKPIELKIPPGGGGNWDTVEIKRLSKSIGITIKLPKALNTSINQPFRDDKGPLRLIKDIRNKLAHGSLSFTECGNNHVASDFRKLIDIVTSYLKNIIASYEQFIDVSGFKVAQD